MSCLTAAYIVSGQLYALANCVFVGGTRSRANTDLLGSEVIADFLLQTLANALLGDGIEITFR